MGGVTSSIIAARLVAPIVVLLALSICCLHVNDVVEELELDGVRAC